MQMPWNNKRIALVCLGKCNESTQTLDKSNRRLTEHDDACTTKVRALTALVSFFEFGHGELTGNL
jgi:hypothetical protein